jgi:hypothetical protein
MATASRNGTRFGTDRERGLFPTFFLGGFECSTFIWKDGERKDYVALTGHDRHLKADYEKVLDLGIGVIREAVRWPLIDKGRGKYDWSTLDQVLEAASECHLTLIWDLCHYGFPDETDPLCEDCLPRFVDYCRAAAERIRPRTRPPHFFTPMNEITFLAGAATDMGWVHPFAKGRYCEMKTALCRMAIEGVRAIREVIPEARMVHVDPIIHEIPETQDEKLAKQAWDNAYDKAYEAWDMLYGKLHPELGGSPEILDIVGVNVYAFCQAILKADGKRDALGPNDPRRKPLSEMLMYGWERYHRPMIIGETSGSQDGRAGWLCMVMRESLKALNQGIDLQGICLYPCVDIPDWNTGKPAQIGIFDLPDLESCERVPCEAYIEELRRWQKILDHPGDMEPEALRVKHVDAVQLNEVRDCARKWGEQHPDFGGVKAPVKQAA